MSALRDAYARTGAGCAMLPNDGTVRTVESDTLRLIPSLDLPDAQLDALIDEALGSDLRLLVPCGRTLNEVGRIDARFGKSPVMLLHEFGLLRRSTVLSGVYLDKEDLALLGQENVPLCVLPTSDAGHGYGIAPVCAARKAGVRLVLGTDDGVYNPRRSVVREAAILRLLTAAQMNKENALDLYAAAAMCVAENADEQTLAAVAKEIERM